MWTTARVVAFIFENCGSSDSGVAAAAAVVVVVVVVVVVAVMLPCCHRCYSSVSPFLLCFFTTMWRASLHAPL